MLLITLALLLVLCQRKQRKNKLAQTVKKPDVTVTAEEFFKEDRNSNISDLKLELAHGNGHCEVVSLGFDYTVVELGYQMSLAE